MLNMELKRRCTPAATSGDIDTVRRLFEENPELASDPDYKQGLLKLVTRTDQIEVVKFLVEQGADIHAPIDSNAVEGVIYTAAINDAISVARWLLSQNVQLNFIVDGEERCMPLTMAASHGQLELVKLLVEHGANVNATWNEENPLNAAIAAGRQEVVEYLRSMGAKTPQELGLVDSSEAGIGSHFLDHLTQYLGTPEPLALREIVPTDLPLAIHVIRSEDEQILVTEGMSARPMTVPAGGEAFQFAELVLRLPSDWPLTLEAFANPNHYWPIEWLKRIARYPHDNDTWLGGPHTIIANGDPPEPFAPNTKMSCLMLLANPSDFGRWTRPSDGAEVVFYDIFGLYTEERDLELRKGLPELLGRFQERFVSKTLDPQRYNVAL